MIKKGNINSNLNIDKADEVLDAPQKDGVKDRQQADNYDNCIEWIEVEARV